jgi:hypothetical protein
MSSHSSSSDSNKDSDLNLSEKTDINASLTKQRYSPIYQYFTFNPSTCRWSCDYCE